MKPSSIIRVPTSLNEFFKNWLIFLKPFHELTDRQIDLAAAFLKARYELSKVIADESILDENVMSINTRKKIMEECGFTIAHFQVIIGDLKKHKFLVDGKINKRYIPNLTKENSDSYALMIYFPFKKDE